MEENHQNHNPNQDPDLKKQQIWGTWEELLLASAVNRHGFKDWDTVAMEVQSRTTLPHLHATARHCEQKFHDLNRRFTDQCNDDSPSPLQNGAASGDGTDHVPWLDELRKLRVDELRREVQHYDVSILSLQLKVKKLEAEREKETDGKEDEKPDLEVSGKKRPDNDKTGGERQEREETEPVSSEPEIRRLDESTTNTDKVLPTAGEESDREENQSVNESNSTGSRFEGGKTGEGDLKLGPGPDPVHTGPKEPDLTGRKKKPVGEESNNGSCDNAAKVITCESVPPSEERKEEGEEDDSSELRDSVAHSGEGGTTRESSEVQSSASLTRKRKARRRKEVSGGSGGGEVNDDMVAGRSEPLVGVLEMIKRHEHSSLFERRLDSQESDRYKNTVRRHVDLETIQMRLQKGHYSSCTSAFFRDLLLFFTNATVFYPKDSDQSRAAQQLLHLVIAEMKNQGQAQSDPITQKTDSPSPNPPQAKLDSLFSKHKASAPILVCRKRSAISAKPSSATFGQKGDELIINDKKEKPSSDTKPHLKPPPSSETDEEEEPPRAKEKPVTGARSLRRSNKNLNSNPGNKKLPSNSASKAGSLANKPAETPKLEKSKAEGSVDKKKNAAADFLKRIKRNAPVEVLKSGGGSGGGSSSSSRGGGGGVSRKEQKKVMNSGKGDKGKERASRHNGGGGSGSGSGSGSGDKRNKNIENSSQSKRSVGRPPKKAAETNAGSAKRGRESSASAGKDKRPKKRSKK